ncbi:MAG: peptidylprolyl isomerase [Nitrospinaceae bacterium]|jgi:FKBP-type peptidyl-prolyl cis-trans isomerase 2|nr:peptidylprolyl isomerase [Nitrospinaceae bacterium]HAK38373.1 peptidylprolyl isomerase [Nitrospina sp.]|tara:strand:+ start:2442 stop:2960 length:519 start_codon:yes stop_codon:yes gene_type:complete
MKSIAVARITCFFILAFYFAVCGTPAFADGAAKKGDKVAIEYEGSLDDGTVFDSSKNHDKPLEFVVGSGQVIPGFDRAVTGMKVNEEKKIRLEPTDAYGEKNPKLTHKIARTKLPPKPEPKPGMGLMMGAPGQPDRRAMITEVTKDHVVIDMNHPLAGKALTFAIKLVKISH